MEQKIHGNTKQKDQSLSGTESRGSDGLNSVISGVVFGLKKAKSFPNGIYTVFQTAYLSASHHPFSKINSSSQTCYSFLRFSLPPLLSPDVNNSRIPRLISEGRFWVKSPWWSVWQWVESAQWCNGCRVEVSAATQVDSPGPYRVIIMATGIMATVTMGVMVSTAVVVDVLLLPPVGPQRVTKHLHRNM